MGILGENESNDKKLAAIDKSPQLITVEDFLSLTEHKYPLPRIDSAGINEAAEDLQSEDIPEEEDGTYQHNSNDPTSVILKLDDSTDAVSISGSLESFSSPTQEAQEDYLRSSIEENFLLELENFISLNDVVDDMISQIEDSFDTHEAQDRNEGKTGMNLKVDKVNDNSDPSSDGYVEEQSS